MIQIQFQGPGLPPDVVEWAVVPAPVVVADDDILVAVDAFPINPADLLTLAGIYPRTDASSPTLGVEAAGVVEAVGAAVPHLASGDRVLLLGGNNWSRKRLVKTNDVVHLPSDIDPLQAAALKVAPATAALLLSEFVALRQGDWLVQNAANSAVGRALIRIATLRGLKTINVVRRESLIEEMKALGADSVLVDGEDLAQRVASVLAGQPAKLAVDAVGGVATGRLAECLAPGGTLVVYGAMSGEPMRANPGALIFKNVSLRGYWHTRYLATAPRGKLLSLYNELAGFVQSGRYSINVDSIFPPKDIKKAVARAGEAGRAGKVFVSFA